MNVIALQHIEKLWNDNKAMMEKRIDGCEQSQRRQNVSPEFVGEYMKGGRFFLGLQKRKCWNLSRD